MRLICQKCDKEIQEYKIDIIKQDNGLYMHMITVECHGGIGRKCFEDRHGPGFNTFVYENVYFFEEGIAARIDKWCKAWEARLEACCKTLTQDGKGEHSETFVWSKAKPTKPGWYWRNREGRKFIEWVNSILIDGVYQLAVINWNSAPCALHILEGEWSGPIPEPVNWGETGLWKSRPKCGKEL